MTCFVGSESYGQSFKIESTRWGIKSSTTHRFNALVSTQRAQKEQIRLVEKFVAFVDFILCLFVALDDHGNPFAILLGLNLINPAFMKRCLDEVDLRFQDS